MLAEVGRLLQEDRYKSKAGCVPTVTANGVAKGVHYIVMADVGERIKPHHLTRTLAAQVRVPDVAGRWLCPAYVCPLYGARLHYFQVPFIILVSRTLGTRASPLQVTFMIHVSRTLGTSV